MYLSEQERDRRYTALRASMAREDIPVLWSWETAMQRVVPFFPPGDFAT